MTLCGDRRVIIKHQRRPRRHTRNIDRFSRRGGVIIIVAPSDLIQDLLARFRVECIGLYVAVMKRMIPWEIAIWNLRKSKENRIHNLLAVETQSNCLTRTLIAEEIRASLFNSRGISCVIRGRDNSKGKPFHPGTHYNVGGNTNNALGSNALAANTTGFANNAFGAFALNNTTTSGYNSAFGDLALPLCTGGYNTAIGANAGGIISTGERNVCVGYQAGGLIGPGSNNIILGAQSGVNVSTASNVICIGANTGGENVDNSCYLNNISGQPGGAQAVYVAASGKLGAQVSSQRFKDEIKPMEQASEVIYQLRPVSFRYKPEIEPTRPLE